MERLGGAQLGSLNIATPFKTGFDKPAWLVLECSRSQDMLPEECSQSRAHTSSLQLIYDPKPLYNKESTGHMDTEIARAKAHKMQPDALNLFILER